MVHVVFLIDPIPVVELEQFIPICYKLHAFRFLTAYFLWMLKGVGKKKTNKQTQNISAWKPKKLRYEVKVIAVMSL